MAGVPGVPLKGPHTNLLKNLLSLSSSTKAAGTELSGFKVRAGGETSFQTEVLAESIVSSLSPPQSGSADISHGHT